MSFSGHRLRRMSLGGGVRYPHFLAHITEMAEFSVSGGGSLGASGALGSYRVTSLAAVGTMGGSSWGLRPAGFSYSTTMQRAVQHGLPSLAIFNQQIDNGGQVLCLIEEGIRTSPSGSLNRNGFNSSGAGDTTNKFRMAQLLYWDFDQNLAFEMRPFAQSGPFLYEW